jgi:glycerol kinase
VIRPAITETTALGAAYLAGLAVGFWKSLDEVKQHWKVDKTFYPQQSDTEINRLRERWHDALERSKAWDRPISGK